MRHLLINSVNGVVDNVDRRFTKIGYATLLGAKIFCKL